ncbi:Hypothetical predicted protein [Paramuricea clavata]|uniref:Uncharacterized protein n=1 Tax=Paramuricea clavata TaxID=317549 RepID=A0A7D9JY61_PARCT|nr:Hypothetical predicted protein [Paramuricea clavata]
MVGPKTSLFIQVVAAASIGGAIGFYIQHRVWSVEKKETIFELEEKIREKKEIIQELRENSNINIERK